MTQLDPELLSILVCPESHQKLSLAEEPMVAAVNASIAAGTQRTVAGAEVSEAVDGGLVREDGKVFYPIRESIPVLLVEEGLTLGD